ncbi:MAG: DUF3160 domain-containing protein [Deltaproteobacteria bacterium]|nr:DUF3160 domain-containing protein [Deltaproteobacteria bacterium]
MPYLPLAFAFLLGAASPAAPGASIDCLQSADVDGDGKPDSVERDLGQAGIRSSQHGFLPLPVAAPAVERICLADLQADGRTEVLVGLWRATPKDPRLARRLFVFWLDYKSLAPMHMGTWAGGELVDFGTGDPDGDGKVEVLTRELDKDGRCLQRVYAWEGYSLTEQTELTRACEQTAEQALQPGFAPRPPARALLDVPSVTFERTSGRIRGRRVRAQLANIANRKRFQYLPHAARQHLVQHGFAVLRPAEPPTEFHSLYVENLYRSMPSFVTADAALHMTHLVFDQSLQAAEREVLAPTLARAVSELLHSTRRLDPGAPAPLRPALRRQQLRLAIAATLLGAEPAGLGVPAAEIQPAIQRIQAASSLGDALVPDGYAQFKLRGHYTRSETLGRYFRAFVFLSQPCCGAPEDAAVLAALLSVSPAARQILAWLEDLQRALIGPAASKSALDLLASLEPSKASWKPFLDSARWPSPEALAAEPVSLLARRWPADNSLLLRGTDPDDRPMPSPLDLLSALGSDRALELLDAECKRWPPLAGKLAEARAAVRGGALDTSSVGGRWLASLRWLLLPYPAGYAAFQRSSAWPGHALVSAAGSWAELRRDTVLYVKPPVVWLEGGDEESLPPSKAGWVEPVPELYAELGGVVGGFSKSLVAFCGQGLLRGGERMRASGPARKLQQAAELLAFLEQTARKELAGKGLSRDEHDQLCHIGSQLESILAGKGTMNLEPVPVIADVFYVGDPETNERRPLLVATGPVDEIVVAVPLGKRTILARGAVFSFHAFEFDSPMSDEEWRAMLSSGKAPAAVDWVKRFVLKARARRRARK